MATTQAEETRDSTLKAAGEIVALLAGVVAAVYILGGVVLAVRLLSDGFPADAVVDLLGQAPRELVISSGLVQAIGPAVLFGIGAGLVYGVHNGPKPRSDTKDDKLTASPHQVRTCVGLVLLTFALTLPGAFLSAATDDLSGGEAFTWAATFAVTGPLVFAGWFIKRRLARKRAWYRFVRAAAGAGIWASMALVPTIFAVGVLPFQTAQVCVQETGGEPTLIGKDTPLTLVAQTGDRTILAVEKTGEHGKAKSILSLPTDKITRLQFGELDAAGMSCTGDP